MLWRERQGWPRPWGPVLLQSLQEPFAGHRTLGLAKEAL